MSAAWPDTRATARAELYFELDGAVFPERPPEYAAVGDPPAPLEIGGGEASAARPPARAARGGGIVGMMRQVRDERRALRAPETEPASAEEAAARSRRELRARAAIARRAAPSR